MNNRQRKITAKGYMKYPILSKTLSEIRVGDIVTYGNYAQDAEGKVKTPIEWLVLDKRGSKVMLLSKYGLRAKAYNEQYTDVTWQTCTLRTWLNTEFFQEAFSEEEQKRIPWTVVHNQDNLQYNTPGGADTEDRVFLLSLAEAERYFSENEARKCLCTDRADKEGAYQSDEYLTPDGKPAIWWWLRSPGHNDNRAAYVHYGGALGGFGDNVYDDYGCVRPAFFLNL